MIAILIAFYVMVGFFALIGAIRGWAKELLVIFSVVLALALIFILETLVPGLNRMITSNSTTQFWVRIGILVAMVFFGYQSPRIARIARAAERRDQIQDTLLGIILGAVSGYMVIGSLWYFLHQADYFPPYVVAPLTGTPLGDTAYQITNYLPPALLMKSPLIFIAVVVAFIFVMIVFI